MVSLWALSRNGPDNVDIVAGLAVTVIGRFGEIVEVIGADGLGDVGACPVSFELFAPGHSGDVLLGAQIEHRRANPIQDDSAEGHFLAAEAAPGDLEFPFWIERAGRLKSREAEAPDALIGCAVNFVLLTAPFGPAHHVEVVAAQTAVSVDPGHPALGDSTDRRPAAVAAVFGGRVGASRPGSRLGLRRRRTGRQSSPRSRNQNQHKYW